MRKFLVKNLIGYRYYNAFGVSISLMRCVRIGWPVFICLMVSGILSESHKWAKYPFIISGILMLIYVWMTFSWFGLGYFELWPVKYEEMDEIQKEDYRNYHNLKP